MRVFCAAVALSVALLQGCAVRPQQTVPLASGYFTAKSNRIAVAMTPLPKADTAFPGAGCLLCLAAAVVTNKTLTEAVRVLPADDLKPLKTEIGALLKANAQSVVVLEEPLDLAKYPERRAEQGFSSHDFSSLSASANVGRLLVIDVFAVGVWRYYSAYVPTGAPRAVFKARAYIVDLSSNRYDLYQEFHLSLPAEGAWSEPPKFPGLTNAYFQLIERGKDDVKKALVP